MGKNKGKQKDYFVVVVISIALIEVISGTVNS